MTSCEKCLRLDVTMTCAPPWMAAATTCLSASSGICGTASSRAGGKATEASGNASRIMRRRCSTCFVVYPNFNSSVRFTSSRISSLQSARSSAQRSRVSQKGIGARTQHPVPLRIRYRASVSIQWNPSYLTSFTFTFDAARASIEAFHSCSKTGVRSRPLANAN